LALSLTCGIVVARGQVVVARGQVVAACGWAVVGTWLGRGWHVGGTWLGRGWHVVHFVVEVWGWRCRFVVGWWC
jgi:hypothetical protein